MRTVGSILFALTLVACGGGGGGGGGGNGSPTGPNNPGPAPAPSSASVAIQGQGDGYSGTVWSFNPTNVTVARGGTVTWTNGTGELHNVTFTASAGAPASIGDHSSGSNSRTFSSSGTFTYRCTIHDITGQVVAQ